MDEEKKGFGQEEQLNVQRGSQQPMQPSAPDKRGQEQQEQNQQGEYQGWRDFNPALQGQEPWRDPVQNPGGPAPQNRDGAVGNSVRKSAENDEFGRNAQDQAVQGPGAEFRGGYAQGGQSQQQYAQQAQNDQQQYSRQEQNDRLQYDRQQYAQQDTYQPQPPRKKRKGAGQLVAIILVIVLAAGCGFGGGIAAVRLAPDMFGYSGTGGSAITINPDSKVDTAEAIAAKVMPSVVGISTQSVREISDPFMQMFGMGGQSQITEGVGTGVIVDSNGYILTNSHVVNDGDTKSIKVQLYDGRELDGSVLWNDKTLDLAIVKVDATGLTAAELGDSDEMKIGSYTAAIGNPLGLEFQRSMSQGIISGLDRSITVTDGSSRVTMDGLMQTDASINSGNSGGPLLNSKGEVIGINSAKVQSGEGMGFAIPINVAKPIIQEIKEKGEFTRAYIGIEAFGLGDYSSAYPSVNLEEQLGTDQGIYVQNVTAGGGAEAAGVQDGDIITELNGEKVTSMNGLNTKLIQYRPGEKVTLTILRDKKEMKLDVTLKAGTTV